MMNDEELVRRDLARLAQHAPTFRSTTQPRTAGQRRYAVPLLIGASVAVLALVTTVLATHDQTPIASDPGVAATTESTDPPALPPESPLRFEAVKAWTHQRLPDCSGWNQSGVDTVLHVDRLSSDCISRANRAATTVLIAPFAERGPFGEPWADVTAPWRHVGGHQVNRLSGGLLMGLSSRVVDALVCASCGEVAVVLGPDPAEVRRIVESVYSE